MRTTLFQIGAQVYYDEDPQLYDKQPIELIVKAHSKNNYIGSATMVVLTLDGTQLRSCYIGGTIFKYQRQWVYRYQSHRLKAAHYLSVRRTGTFFQLSLPTGDEKIQW